MKLENGVASPLPTSAKPSGALHDAESGSTYDSVEHVLDQHVPAALLPQVKRILYGSNQGASPRSLDAVPEAPLDAPLDVKGFAFYAKPEQFRAPRLATIGLVQHSIKADTSEPFSVQRRKILDFVGGVAKRAAGHGVQILCLQECFSMPFGFCTREKVWAEFAESAYTGESVVFCQELAKAHDMVVVCPILERDETHGDTCWNTAVVIEKDGSVLGIHRKNHIPRVGDFNESTYYMEGNTGHPVFHTSYGSIAVNICYGRHHPLNWMAFGLNGAEIVFNPSCTADGLSEPLWAIEARNAAIANGFYIGAINRTGTEVFPNAFTSGDGRAPHHDFGHFYGSSYVAAPDGSRTPGLSRYRDGLMVAQLDLNLCRQVKDSWGFTQTGRHDMYEQFLHRYNQPNFEPQVIARK